MKYLTNWYLILLYCFVLFIQSWRWDRQNLADQTAAFVPGHGRLDLCSIVSDVYYVSILISGISLYCLSRVGWNRQNLADQTVACAQSTRKDNLTKNSLGSSSQICPQLWAQLHFCWIFLFLYILSQNPKVGHSQSWQIKQVSLPQSISNIKTIIVSTCFVTSQPNIYFVLKSVEDFQFTHSNHFPELAKCADIDHRSTEPIYSNNQIFLCENKRCLPNCW